MASPPPPWNSSSQTRHRSSPRLQTLSQPTESTSSTHELSHLSSPRRNFTKTTTFPPNHPADYVFGKSYFRTLARDKWDQVFRSSELNPYDNTEPDYALRDSATDEVRNLNRAVGLASMGRFREAAKAAERVVKARVDGMGKTWGNAWAGWESVAQAFEYLLWVYRCWGRWSAADKTFEQWETLVKDGDGDPESIPALKVLFERAQCEEGKGMWKKAEELYDFIYTRRSALEEDHGELLETLEARAMIKLKLGKWAEALQDAKELHSQFTGKKSTSINDQHVLRAKLVLGCIRQAKGEWKVAHDLFSEVHLKRVNTLKETHPETLRAAIYLASAKRRLGMWLESEKLICEVLNEYRKMYEEDHPNFALAKYEICATYIDQGRYREAERLLQHMLASMAPAGKNPKVSQGKEPHPYYLRVKALLAKVYRELEEWPKCEELCHEVIEDGIPKFGEKHPFILAVNTNLAVALVKNGHDFNPYIQRCHDTDSLLKDFASVFGEKHPDTLAATAFIVQELRPVDAEEKLKQVMRLREHILGETHPDTLFVSVSLATVQIEHSNCTAESERTEELKAAEDLLSYVLRTTEGTLGWEHPKTLKALIKLAVLYFMIHRLDKATEICLLIDKTVAPDFLTTSNLKAIHENPVGRYQRQALDLVSRIYMRQGRILESHEVGAKAMANFMTKSVTTSGQVSIIVRDKYGELVCTNFGSANKDSVELTKELSIRTNTRERPTQRLFQANSESHPYYHFTKEKLSATADSRHADSANQYRDLLSKHFDISAQTLEGRRRETKASDEYSSNLDWLWSYRSKIRVKDLVSSQLPTPEMVDSAGIYGKLIGSISHQYPRFLYCNGSPVPAGRSFGDVQTVRLDKPHISSRWIMLVRESNSPKDASLNSTGQSNKPKYMLCSSDFLGADIHCTYSHTSLQFLLEHFRLLLGRWAEFIKQSKVVIHADNYTVLDCHGSNAELISSLLRTAQVFSAASDMITSHIRSAAAVEKTFCESKVLLDEVEEWETQESLKSGTLLSSFSEIRTLLQSTMHDVEFLSSEIQRLIILEFNLVSIHEAHQSVSKTTSLQRLSWITFICLPLLVVSSLFGMNVDLLSKERDNPRWWWYPVICSIVTAIIWIGWAAFKAWDRHSAKNNMRALVAGQGLALGSVPRDWEEGLRPDLEGLKLGARQFSDRIMGAVRSGVMRE